MDQPILEPIEVGSGPCARWMVVIYNNDTNTLDEVVTILLEATGCSIEEAALEVWEAQAFGKAPVHFASREACTTVAHRIGSIGVKTDVAPEWES